MPVATQPDLGVRSGVLLSATPMVIAVVLLFVSRFAIVGADSHWLVALGDHILANGRLPEGLPFAAAPTEDWPNVLVFAELVFASLHKVGDSGLAAAQLVCDAIALALLALGARRLGASDAGTAVTLSLVALGSLPAMVVIRLQLLSLVPFAAMLLLLRSQHLMPSRRIWWLVPLFALWSNLHGAVLMGFAVTSCYLLLSRLRETPGQAVLVGLASFAAFWLTPAGLDTGRYYLGVLGNEAAERGTDLWARPSLSRPFDVLMLVAALALLGLASRRRLPLWEYAALAGLAVGTAMAARHGLWLLMLVAAPAAVSLKGPVVPNGAVLKVRSRYVPWVFAALAVMLGMTMVARGESVSPVRPAVVEGIAQAAGTHTVLAPEPLVESLAVAGVRVWAADPIDAFTKADQSAYLDFLAGKAGASRALEGSDIVVVEPKSRPADTVAGRVDFALTRTVDGWDVYTRVP